VIAGVAKSQFDTILVMDADGSHSPSYIPEMLQQIQTHDLVTGKRIEYESHYSFLRVATSWLFNSSAQKIHGLTVDDAMTGFVMGKKEWFLKLKPSKSYKFLLQLLDLKPKVKEVPITFFSRKAGQSKATFMTAVRAGVQISTPLKFWIPALLAFFFSVALALYYLQPIGADIHFHWQIAQVWALLENGFFSTVALEMNQIPYPPLLHWILVPAFWLRIKTQFTLLLQVILFPLGVYAMMKVTQHMGRLYSLLTGILVMGSLAYIDRLFQVQPQALSMVLLPLAFYYRKDSWKFVLVSVAMVWNHGLIAAPLLAGLWLYRIYEGSVSKKHVFSLSLGSFPIVALSLLFLAAGLSRFIGSGFENAQEAAFWNDPLFSLVYMRLLWLGFPLAIYKMMQWKKLGVLEKESLVTLASMLPLIVWQADRFLQFSTIPLALLMTCHIKQAAFRQRESWFWISFIMFFLMYATLWLWLVVNGYDVR
jgi:hypothetical protein